jgi:hypothetical protein
MLQSNLNFVGMIANLASSAFDLKPTALTKVWANSLA